MAEPMSDLVHQCPPTGTGTTPCCGRTLHELPTSDRVTGDPTAVRCPGAEPDDPHDLALTECCIDTCDRLAHVVIESYPDDIGLCREHRPLHGPLEPFETVRVIGESDDR